MEISVKDFSEMKKAMISLTKTLKNFDDRLNEVENNVNEVAETVTVELPKAIAEQVDAALNTAVETNGEAPAEEAPAEDGGEPCPNCGNSPCTCEGSEEAPAEDGNFCGGDEKSFEEFSQKVTETIEDLAGKANEIAERVNKMFIKVFSEGDAQIGDVTAETTDVQKVEKALKENPDEFVETEETDDKAVVAAPAPAAEVVVATTTPVPPAAPVEEDQKQFSATRYETVKNIFNL